MKIKKNKRGEMALSIGACLITFGILTLAFDADRSFLIFSFLIVGMLAIIYGIFASGRIKKDRTDTTKDV